MMDNRTLLAFDTTGKGSSFSVYHQGRFHDLSLPEGGSQLQSSQLVPCLMDLCSQAGCTLGEITTVLTMAGPGSFTGIRLGLATAIGLKLGLSCATFAPSCLHVMAYKALQIASTHPCLALIDTQREDFYGLLVDASMTEIIPSQIYTQEHVAQIRNQYPDASIVSNIPTDFSDLLSINAQDLILYYLKAPQNHDWSSLTPYYIRHPEFVKQKRYQHENP